MPQRFKVSTKVSVGADSEERRATRRLLRDVPHCQECLTTDADGDWVYVDCAGIERFCSWECLFVWTAGLMPDCDVDPRIKVKYA